LNDRSVPAAVNRPDSRDAHQIDVAARLARIRKLIDDLDKAMGTADDQRALLAQIREDADAAYKTLVAKL
jgi:hypothetical protein